jgi:hypothetical protein
MKRAALGVALLAALLPAGCGSGDAGSAATGGDAASPPPATSSRGAAQQGPGPLPYDRLDEPRCDPSEANCAEARGQIAAVERVDPDGDGDAHFVLLSSDGITTPGVTIVDVEASLRPSPLPGRGDLLAAAGPVYPGGLGQKQIQATAIDFVRVRDGG